MKFTIQHLALFPLLLLPLACTDRSDGGIGTGSNTGYDAGATDGVHAAERPLGDRANNDRGSNNRVGASSAGAASVADGLSELQPRVDAAIARLERDDTGSGANRDNNLSQLRTYRQELPALVQRLRNASGAELNTAVEHGRAMLNEIPQMLSNIGV